MYTRLDNIKNDEIVWIEYKPKFEGTNSTWIQANQNTYMGEVRQLGMDSQSISERKNI